MKPLFKYYGGKQRMVNHILPLFPYHRSYVEPFAGGAALFFAKEPVAHEVLNDINHIVINFYRVYADPDLCERLHWRLERTPVSREMCLVDAREVYRAALGGEVRDKVELAWAWYVICQQGFGAAADKGFATSRLHMPTVRKRAQQNVSNAAAWCDRISGLRDEVASVGQRMRRAIIDCVDAVKCIQTYDTPETLFYCDPPYLDTHQGHYKGYGLDQYLALLTALETCQGSFVLSSYPNDYVPAHWPCVEVASTCKFSSVYGTGRDRGGSSARTECIWVVDRSTNAQMEIK